MIADEDTESPTCAESCCCLSGCLLIVATAALIVIGVSTVAVLTVKFLW